MQTRKNNDYGFRAIWTDRHGNIQHRDFSTTEEAAYRLIWLDSQESKTRKYAPTDSGDVRFNYCAEADAIREQL